MKLDRIEPAAETGGGAEAPVVLARVRASLDVVAAGLDARFVEAGGTLAHAYELVEKLVASLEGATQALDRAAADAAVERLQRSADRLARIPALQEARRAALRTIAEAGAALRAQVAQVDRVLAFLRICGLNIKVTAAGAIEFSGFAETMFEKLDAGEAAMCGIADDVERLTAGLAPIVELEQKLSAECAGVVPQVPERLAENATTLRQHEQALAEQAARVADVARDVRATLATAIGALQIGDITRQRVEHVAQGLALLDAADLPGEAAESIRGHVLALLAGQLEALTADFVRESRMLAHCLGGIAPGTAALLAFAAGGVDGDSDGHFLVSLESDVAEVQTVTLRLREAEASSMQLSAATSATADSLARRLDTVRRIQDDVQQMAWNTDLRCYRMGEQGRGLSVIASGVRNHAKRLKEVYMELAQSFAGLSAAAQSIRDREQGAEIDVGQALADALACIHDGGLQMDESSRAAEAAAPAIRSLLQDTSAQIDCEAEVGEQLTAAAQLLGMDARPLEQAEGATAEALNRVMAAIAASYTMASEREFHRQFERGEPAEPASAPAAAPPEDDDDDGLF